MEQLVDSSSVKCYNKFVITNYLADTVDEKRKFYRCSQIVWEEIPLAIQLHHQKPRRTKGSDKAHFRIRSLYFQYFASFGIIVTYLNIYYVDQGLTGVQIGVLSAVAPLVAIFVAPMWGVLSDRFGAARKLLIIACIGILFAIGGIYLSDIFSLLILFTLVFAVFECSILPILDSATLLNLGDDRSGFGRERVAQRRVSRRKKGSKRWRKAVRQVARLHEQITNQRNDYWHKLTRELAENHSLIAIEDLNLKFINMNRYLSLSSHDAGLGMFTQMLAYKVEETGCQLVAVNPAYTSQRCSRCGLIVEKDLSVRVHDCPECGLVLDRDVNAARNVLRSAFSSLGRSDQDLTWVVTPSVS